MAENGIIGNTVLWTIQNWVRLDVSTIHISRSGRTCGILVRNSNLLDNNTVKNNSGKYYQNHRLIVVSYSKGSQCAML